MTVFSHKPSVTIPTLSRAAIPGAILATVILVCLVAPAHAGVAPVQLPAVLDPPEVVRLAGAADVRVLTKCVGGAGGAGAPFYTKAVALAVTDVTGRQLATVYMLDTNPGFTTLRADLLDGKKYKFGDCLKVVTQTIKIADKAVVLDSVEPYTLTPGEDRPDVYIFREAKAKTVGQETATFVTAQKLGREYSFVVVPTVKNAQGKLDSDKSLLARLASFAADDLVVLQAEGKYGSRAGLVGAAKYVLPEQATFVALGKENGNRGDCDMAMLKKGDAELRMLVPKLPAAGWSADKVGPPASVSDPKLLAVLKGFKKGAAVEYLAAADDDADGVLTSIAPAVPPADTVMADVAPAGGGAAGDSCVAYIAIAEIRTYVAGLEPVVSNNAVAFRPILGTVGTGAVLVIVDAVIKVYRQ